MIKIPVTVKVGFLLVLLANPFCRAQEPAPSQPGPIVFEPNIKSLKQYVVPEWFEDAKFGIWAHWGPQGSTQIPGGAGWYARDMYVLGSRVNVWHTAHYGDPAVFGYKDLLKQYNPSKFDAAQADKLMKLYKAAGAKFFMALAVHHDNFDMWDSTYQPRWNAKAITGKDIVGIWHTAAVNNGLRFGVSSHVARSYRWFQTSHGSDAMGKFDGQDPQYQDLYGVPWPSSNPGYEKMKDVAPPAWEDLFEKRMIDLVDKYHPDLYYTDGGIPFKHAGLDILSHFYNANQRWNNGKLEAVATIKVDYVENIAVQDYEFASSSSLATYPFMSDKSTNHGWFWAKGEEARYKKANVVIPYLVDLVSKNGCLCLNIPLTPAGELEPESVTLLTQMAQCMNIIGESIFSTRPWIISGEGPTKITGFAMGTAQDIRFTRNKAGDVLYAILLAWPGNGATATIHTLTADKLDALNIDSIHLLGFDGALTWKQTTNGLEVNLPNQQPASDYAFSLKIGLKKPTLLTQRL